MWRTSCCGCLRIMRAVPLLQGFLHEEELCEVALTCHFSFDVFSVRTERQSDSRVTHVASFSDDAEQSGFGLQHEVSPRFCLCFAVSFVAHCCSVLSLLPSRIGCTSKETGWNVCQYFSSAFFFEGEAFFSGHLCCACCQPEDRQSSTGSVVVTATCATAHCLKAQYRVALALGLLRLSKLGMTPLRASFSVGMGLFWEVPDIETSTRDPSLGLSLPFWVIKKTSECEHSKHQKNHAVDPPKKHVV